MFKRKFFKALLGIGAGLMFAPMAMATCSPTSLYGTCLWYTGSVWCNNLSAVGIGSTNNTDKFMNCSIESTGTDASGNPLPIQGVLFCANKGGKVAPGVNAFANDGFTGTATITTSQIDTNGTAHGINVEALATDQLASMNQYCQNPNWNAIDFVPSAMNTMVTVTDSSGDVVSTSTWYCELPNPDTLTWDTTANAPETRQYNCTQIQ